MLNPGKLKVLLDAYKEDFRLHWKDEAYKWEAVKHFQDNWDLGAPDFGEMFRNATKRTINLLDTGHAHPRSIILKFSEIDDDAVRSMFRNLFDENRELKDRIRQFQLLSDNLFSKLADTTEQGHYQSTNAISTYLWLMFPDKYYKYTYDVFHVVSAAVDSDYSPKRNGSVETMVAGMKFYDELREYVRSDAELCSLVEESLLPDCYPDLSFTTATIDVGFYIAKYYPARKSEEGAKNMEIDYISILNFIEKYFDYKLVEDFQKTEFTNEIRVSEYKAVGEPILEDLQRIGDEIEKRFALKLVLPAQLFFNVGADKVDKRRYLCLSFKYDDYFDSPINVSVFAEKIDEITVLYRVGLDIEDSSSDEEMQQFHSHFDNPVDSGHGLIYVGGSNKFGRPYELAGSSSELREQVASGWPRKVGISRYVLRKENETNEYFQKEIMRSIREILPYYQYVLGIESPKYFPSFEEYDPSITKENWDELLHDPLVTYSVNLAMLKMMMELGGEATCTRLAKEYGGVPSSYLGLANTFGLRVHKKTNCPLYEDGDRRRVYTIMFVGRNVLEDGKERFSWKLRPELEEALEDMDLSGIDTNINELPIATVTYDKNMILYGPPGTGKTYKSAIYAVAICDNKPLDELYDYDEVMQRYRELKEEGRIAFTTFHQSYGYEEFIEGIKPVVDSESSDVKYTIEPGSFKRFCDKAREDSSEEEGKMGNRPYVFIIDEINRGNISKIFGELITLIETTKREGMKEAISAILPYSGESFSVPSNVYILGTMNTADRSIALMDTALRRRFHFVEMMPDVKVLQEIGADRVRDLDVSEMLRVINERITFLYDREHTIGHAFFTGLANTPTVEALAIIFKKSIIPLLQEYFYEDYRKIQLVLGDNDKEDEYKFIRDTEIRPQSLKGDWSDMLDLSERKYEINEVAFNNIESYKQII